MARTKEQAEAELAEVKTAISSCLKAASYSVAGRSKAMSLLPHLEAREIRLQAEVDSFSSASPVIYPDFPPKS